jgi:hypothetical protein
MRRALAALLVAAGMPACGAERPAGPTVNHYAMEYAWGSPWGGPLEAMLGGDVRLDASSSQPKGFVSKLYDGNAGALADPTGSFLIFDGPRAAVRVRIPAWREVGSVAVYVLEAAGATQASLGATFTKPGSAPARVEFERRVMGRQAGLVHVEYRSTRKEALSAGELLVTYENTDLGSAFVGEVALDGLAATPSAWPDPAPPGSRLLYWRRWDAHGARLHALLIKAAATGGKDRDVAPAWVAHPLGADRKPLPLVVLVADPDTPQGALELLGFAGRPEWALAPRLVEAGLAVLVVDPARATRAAPVRDEEYAARVEAALAQVLDGAFARQGAVAIDRDRVGMWAYGKASSVARVAGSRGRYRITRNTATAAILGAAEIQAIVEGFASLREGR